MKQISFLLWIVMLFLACPQNIHQNQTSGKMPPLAKELTKVKAILEKKCAECHMAAPLGHPAQFPSSKYQCGSCHISQLSQKCQKQTCTQCHESPSATHFFLRGYNKKDTPKLQAVTQSKFAPNIDTKCIECHIRKSRVGEGRGYPPLETDEDILKSVENGTLRSWIQPGGAMAKYLTANEVKKITQWIDGYSQGRKLAYDPYLTAIKAAADFEIDGTGTHPFWAKSPEHSIQLTPTVFTQTDQIKLKALYTKKNLYIRAEWKDSTLSMSRGGWERIAGTWKHPYYDPDNPDGTKQSEDRLSIIWNMSIKNYKTVKGCAVKCHGNIPGSSEFTDLKGEKADIWHTKAARGLGALTAKTLISGKVNAVTHEALSGKYQFTGFLDDKVLVWYQAYALGYDIEDSGRRGDKGTSAYAHNRNKSKKAPLYMEAAPTDFADAMVLTQAEIDEREVITADPSAEDYKTEKVSSAWKIYRKFNALVPERVLRLPTQSRGDVMHSAIWEDGTIINEFQRALDTENPDEDVIFNPSQKTMYEFSVAVFDNCGRGEIPPGHNTYGDGQYQVLRFR